MISLSEILLPEHINLGLDASDESTAVEELLFPLRGDIRISNWEAFRASVLDRVFDFRRRPDSHARQRVLRHYADLPPCALGPLGGHERLLGCPDASAEIRPD